MARYRFGPFAIAVAQLRKAVPPPFPVRVVRAPVPGGIAGDTRLHRRGFVIRVCPRLPEEAAVLVLLHEWAHTFVYHWPHGDHTAAWGVVYAMVWRAFSEPD